MVPEIAFCCLFLVRLLSALYLHITDCDETYNYWEPVHYLLYGKGLQTWEYSPEFGLRSYFYLLIHYVPAWLIKGIFGNTSTSLFYSIRVMLAAVCAVAETAMYRSCKKKFGINVANCWLFFQLLSPGMFISCTAFLPSSFSMYFTMIFFTAWLRKKTILAILSIATSSLVGWPFAALISLPFVYSTLIHHHSIKLFFKWSCLSAIFVGLPLILVDSHYYDKWTIAPLNIILYNVFTSHGPDIFGTESAFYYVINLFLNFNVVWCLVISYPIIKAAGMFLQMNKRNKRIPSLDQLWKISPLYIWILVFFYQPHKEERFLFPIYPLISLCAAFCIQEFTMIWSDVLSGKSEKLLKLSLNGLKIVFLILSVSRTFALYTHYHAPMDIMSQIQSTKTPRNVCVAKEWHRIPGNFLIPKENQLRFVKSHFNGILPAYYDETIKGTSIAHQYFNNLNVANNYMLFNLADCDFLVDSDFGDEYRFNEIEKNYSRDNSTWEIVRSIPFIDSKNSNFFFRAFYVPYVSSKFTKFGRYNLLKRKF